jgi:small subunit ribosomal protein S15
MRPKTYARIYGSVIIEKTGINMTNTEKDAIIKKFGAKDGDVGSPQVQIALMSARIIELTSHMKEHPKDYSSRRGLLAIVTRRRNLLKYLNSKNHAAYLALIQELGLKR